MPYYLTKSNGDPLATIADGAIDSASTSLNLIGKNTTSHGAALNENFVYLTENFASNVAPTSPMVGQIWYDADPTVKQLKVYDGTNWLFVGAPIGSVVLWPPTSGPVPNGWALCDGINGTPIIPVYNSIPFIIKIS